MVEAVIFDMDGVIIDSEPFWRQAEMKVFKSMGIEMTEKMCMQMKGIKIDDVVKHWHQIFQWETPSNKEVEEQIINSFIHLVKTKGQPMSGLSELIKYIKAKGLKIGLATSSTVAIMNATLDKLNLHSSFDVKHSAEHEKNGKPAPDVYLSVAKQLGIEPQNCIAIEDSHTGLRAANSAGMYTVAIPEEQEFESEKYIIANKKVRTHFEILNSGLF